MKSMKSLFLLAVLLVSAGGTWADHGHVRGGVGFYFGTPSPPWYYGAPPYYYYPPPYYPPRVVVVPAAPPPPPPPPLAEEEPAPASRADYWYYCRNAKAYYPQVRECPEGWEQVLPQPEIR